MGMPRPSQRHLAVRLRAMLFALFALLAPMGLLAACTVDPATQSAALQAATGVNDFRFESMDVQYRLDRAEDGTSRARVVETFVADFPETDQNHGMLRRLDESYLDVPLHPQLVSVTDEHGHAREAQVESTDGAYVITSRADEFVHGRQTYVFTYTLENVIRHFSNTDADEFYWDVNGTEWAQPFGRVTARVTMPGDLAGARTGRQACYIGSQGSTDTCEVTSDAAAVVASAG